MPQSKAACASAHRTRKIVIGTLAVLLFFSISKSAQSQTYKVIYNFTGIGSDYQPPAACELTLDTSSRSVAEATDEIERMLARTAILFDELADPAAHI